MRAKQLARSGAKNEKRHPKVAFCLKLARPAGFEPTTPWFVAKYSIQLSYGRNGDNYN